jgi:DNA ligase-1
MTIVQLFNTVKNTAGTNDKLLILNNEMSDLVKDIFEQTYGEHKFYVTKIDVETTGDLTIEEGWADYKQVLWQCECRHITGNEARLALQMELERFQEEDQKILLNVLAHNLKIGVSRDNFQKIAPIFDVYEVSLAEQLADTKGVDPVDGTYFASRKLDGVRCVAFINNWYDENGLLHQDVEFRSRQNKVFTTLDNLKDPVRQMVSPYLGKWVLDGEVCILDENGDEHFDWVMKEITRKNHTIENPCYNVFDLLTQDEFDMKQESPRFEIRLMSIQDLCRQHPDDHIRVLKQERLKCQEDFDRWSGYVTEGHWEGFMLRRDVPYQRGRNKDLLKVKKFKDAEYVVVGTLNSKITYNEDGHKEFDACRALLIEHKGNQVQVGSGLSKEQRLRWYDHPEEIIGKTITVQYFEETKDSKTGECSLRFPVLKFIYEDGRNV